MDNVIFRLSKDTVGTFFYMHTIVELEMLRPPLATQSMVKTQYYFYPVMLQPQGM